MDMLIEYKFLALVVKLLTMDEFYDVTIDMVCEEMLPRLSV